MNFFKGALGIFKSIASLSQRVSDLEAKSKAIDERLLDHLENYHVDIEKKYLNFDHNILWNSKPSKPEPCCSSCHDSKHILARYHWSKLSNGYHLKCPVCSNHVSVSHENFERIRPA